MDLVAGGGVSQFAAAASAQDYPSEMSSAKTG
jgi:hypothetical protein